jgi:PTH1 family peptidyl-tRNA hydrolase
METVVLVGLGNPGEGYVRTRHNLGFQVLDRLADACAIRFARSTYGARLGLGQVEGRRTVLCKPLTYMNRSGEAVKAMLAGMKLSASQMLVIHDDLDLPCGRLKLVPHGGAAGHRGVRSIIEELGHDAFARLKLGIGRPNPGVAVEDYVLQEPTVLELQPMNDMVTQALDVVREFVSMGLAAAMNRFNRREGLPLGAPGVHH